MATREFVQNLDWLQHRLHWTAFEPVRRPDGRIDHDFYAARARRERARIVNRALRATSRALVFATRRGLLAPIRRWYRARRIYNELTALDDRMLRDIGIRRDDIEAIARERWRPHRRQRDERVAYRELAALDDRMLRDIGIERGEIWNAVRGEPRATRETNTHNSRRGSGRPVPGARRRLERHEAA